ncbi:MAG: hypothetical protein ACI97B_003778, partial [Verrucomicrobiales bacterium]
ANPGEIQVEKLFEGALRWWGGGRFHKVGPVGG